MPADDDGDKVPPVLFASVHDVRYFVALLRGVNFSNRATVAVARNGFVVTVEEARTLVAMAYVLDTMFDEYEYHPESDPELPPPPPPKDGEEVEEPTSALEIPLNTLTDCLNIFGTAGAPSLSTFSKHKQWRRADDNDERDRENDHDEDDASRNRGGGHRQATTAVIGGRIDHYFSSSEKRTGMRMSYAGPGHPLTLLLAEDATGPTTTCEIATFDPEPHLDVPFVSDRTVLKIILKSSWLHEALSELDPSCEKLKFIGNPPQTTRALPRGLMLKPMLRIQAAGTFGSTQLDYPNDRDVLETFECTRSVGFSYRFDHISRTLRALQSSTKTSLRIDDEGLLSLQLLMPSPKPQGGIVNAFVEFRFLPLDDEL